MPFEHSFLSGGNDFSVFLNKSFYQHSLLYQSMLLEGVDVVCQTFLLSSCIALSFHTTRKNYSTLIHPFGRGLILYFYTHIYIHTFISRILSIILHASLIPNFRKCHSTIHSFLKRTDFSACFNSFFYPVLLCHFTLLGTCYSTLIHSFRRDSFSYIFSKIFSSILHVSLPFQTLENAIRTFIPFWREWFLCISS